MCKLITIHKKIGENKQISSIIKLQLNAMQTEQNGAACLAVNADGRAETLRSFNYDNVFNFALKKIPSSVIIGLHTRTATQGIINKSNIHYFANPDKSRWMAHNGVIMTHNVISSPRYWFNDPLVISPSASKNNIGFYSPAIRKKSDSREFFDDLPKKLSVDSITTLLAKRQFWGFAHIYDEPTKKSYYIIKKDIKLITNPSYTILSSFSLTLKKHKTVYALSVIPYSVSLKQKIKVHKINEGIYCIDLN